MLRALLELSRVSNLPTVWTNVLAAWIIASGKDWQWTPALGWLLLGASLIYSAGMILNDACDATWDREHRPERPIPSGRIGLKTVWAISLAGLVIGYGLMVFAGGASWKITALLVAAVVAYDVYHKPWAGSVIIMGACRTLLYLAAGSATTSFENLHLAPGTVLGLYIIGLTVFARLESGKKASRFWQRVIEFALMLPAGLMLVAVAMVKGPGADEFNPLPIMLVTSLYILWTGYALVRMSKGGAEIGHAVGFMLAGIPLVDAMVVIGVSQPAALCFCALPPFLRLWQRWIAAT